MASLGPEAVITLADVLERYVADEDLTELCGMLDVSLTWGDRGEINHMKLARTLIEEVEQGNNRRLLDLVVTRGKARCLERIASTQWQQRESHEAMRPRIEELEAELDEPLAPSEVSTPAAHPFRAKSEVRTMLTAAETEVVVVDKWVGPGTLDCLIEVRHPIRLLTGDQDASIGSGFNRTLEEFRSEGAEIEVRRHPNLHDRHLVFNNRLWLLGSSLKDAGRKDFNLIEVVDSKKAIIRGIEAKWAEAKP